MTLAADKWSCARNASTARLLSAGSRTRSTVQSSKTLKIFPTTGLLEEVHHRITVDLSGMVRNQTRAAFGFFRLSYWSLYDSFSMCQRQIWDASRCRAIYANVFLFGPCSIAASQHWDSSMADSICILSTTRTSSSLHCKGFLHLMAKKSSGPFVANWAELGRRLVCEPAATCLSSQQA